MESFCFGNPYPPPNFSLESLASFLAPAFAKVLPSTQADKPAARIVVPKTYADPDSLKTGKVALGLSVEQFAAIHSVFVK